ncbi:ATP synthase subunit d, mitochondrial isoform X2 [Nomia melanderi]|uniref:ATP synthase subunit d, mitochondrial isoform X2 n=1 Tax=Nomia melanderi TaxID=2448451 RepID=UPI001304363A|nr:ATP synthase subunit d, mitochondrial-like isoform X2 [Nomia melanderi]
MLSDYNYNMTANPESPPKIDWAYYRKTITTPGLVDKFQKEYEALSIPFPADKYTTDIDAEEKIALQEVDKFVQTADQEIEKMRKEVARVQSLLPFDLMTIEDYYIMYPENAIDPEKPTVYPHDLSDNGSEETEKSH